MDKIPYESRIEDVLLVNFAGTHQISLMAQMVEMNFFESLFEPLQKATLLLYDAVSLFNNFPLLGEEIVLVKVKPTGDNTTVETYAFVIEGVEQITPSDKSRDITFVLKLTSLTALVNARQSVMHAYHGIYSTIIVDMLDQYVFQQIIRLSNQSGGIKYAISEAKGRDTRINHVESSLGGDEGTLCVPNMRPMTAAKWLASRAVPEDYKNNYTYMFWQANDGFHFETIQKLVKDRSPSAVKYTYYSDISLIKNLAGEDQKLAIMNLVINNRMSTLNKLASGYYENGLFEINMQMLKYKMHKSQVMPDYLTTMEGKIHQNTSAYIEAMLVDNTLNGTNESMNRLKYVVNNKMEAGQNDPLLNYELKWGNDSRSEVAFSSIDLHVTVYGDSSIAAGNVIEIDVPKMEGFNVGDGNQRDDLISGKYIVTEVKHQYVMGQQTSTVMRVNKDDYGVNPDQMSYRYGSAGTTPTLGEQ